MSRGMIRSRVCMFDCFSMAHPSIRPSKPAGVPAGGLARKVRHNCPRLPRASARAFPLPMASLVVDFPRIASPAKEWLTSKVPVWSGFDGNAINRIFIHDIVHSDPIKMAALMATAVTLIGLGGGRGGWLRARSCRQCMWSGGLRGGWWSPSVATNAGRSPGWSRPGPRLPTRPVHRSIQSQAGTCWRGSAGPSTRTTASRL